MCASPLRGAAVADATAEYELRLSAFCFRFFLSVLPFLPVRHPCRSGACQCFHRHLLAAASHGAPNEIGGDGFKCCRERAWAQRCVARMRFYLLLPPIAVRRTASLRLSMRSARWERGTGGLWPPYFNDADAKHRLWVGALQHRPPTPAYFTDLK